MANNIMSRFIGLSVVCLLIGFGACGGGSGGGSGSLSITGSITSAEVEVAAVGGGRRVSPVFYRWQLISPAYADDAEAALPIVAATVELLDANGVLVASTVTDEEGEFAFHNIAPGEYSIVVSSPEMETLTISGVIVLEGDTAVIRGSVAESGGQVTVDYSVNDCEVSPDNQGQIGHAEALADAAGVPVEDVIAAREGTCSGWGVIAQNLGVPPGVLGLGHTQAHGGTHHPDNQGQSDEEHGKPDDAGNPHDDGKGNDNGNNDDDHPGQGQGNPGGKS